jgi:hypothetical protein
MNNELITFIIKARRIGYKDPQITSMLLDYNWPISVIKEGFLDIKKQTKNKVKINVGNKVKTFVYLDKKLVSSLEKRAEKNLFTLQEQIEDILRRSVIGQKKGKDFSDNIDDKFIGIFSRKKTKKN